MIINSTRTAGSGRLGCFFIAIIAALFWKGGQDLYTALSNRKPTVISYEAYVRDKPKASWLELTNCVLDLTEAAYKSFGGGSQPSELYVPVKRARSDKDTVYVLLATKSPQMMSTFQQIQGLHTETEATAFALKNRNRIFPEGPVRGLVRFGIDAKDKDRAKLAKLHANIAPDFIIVADGEAPSLGAGIAFTAAGLAGLVAAIFYLRRKGQQETS